MSGYPDNNPKTMFGLKKCPLHLVPPVATAFEAMAFKDGATKYGPYNWRAHKISASVYYAAAMRHLQSWWDGEELAADSGVHHLAHARACLAMVLDATMLGMINDDRPPKGGLPNALIAFTEKAPAPTKKRKRNVRAKSKRSDLRHRRNAR